MHSHVTSTLKCQLPQKWRLIFEEYLSLDSDELRELRSMKSLKFFGFNVLLLKAQTGPGKYFVEIFECGIGRLSKCAIFSQVDAFSYNILLYSGGPSFGANGALPQLFFRSEKVFKQIAQKTVCKRLTIHPTQFHY